jgi:long-chain fatty acid transport protein
MKRSLVVSSIGAAFALAAGSAYGGAFGIATQTGPGTGNANAGGAAGAEDASVVWTNPAAMSALPQGKHFSLSAQVLRPSFKFRNEGSTIPGVLGSGNGSDGGDWAFVPNGYFAMNLGNKLSIGVGVNAPFGLKTEYDSGWIGQRIALNSEIKTVNINPSIAYKVAPNVSIGAGIDAQYLEAKLTNASQLGRSKLKADDVGWGFNLGVVVETAPGTRIGLHYRSSIKYQLKGDASFSAVPAADADIRADLRVPENVSLSIFSAVTPRWELMADLTWTRWSRIKSIVPVCREVSFGVCPVAGNALVGATLPTNWKDTWRISVGANYKYSPTWKLRFGLAYDPTPTNNTDRTARLPDEDRFWLALGAQYAVSKNGKLDLGYAHEFIRDADVNTQVFGTAFRQRGHFDNRADILTLAYSHSI